MEEQKSIIVGPFKVQWDGPVGLSFYTLNAQENYELNAQESYDLLCFLHDELQQDLYAAAHPAQPGNTNEEGKDEG